MKIYDAGKILTGLLVFVILFTSPFWLSITGEPEYKPEVKYPVNYKECIADKEYMNHYHMNILDDWRNKVVRADIRFFKKDNTYFMIDGEKAEMSLTHTCMKCHDSKADFCDKCHEYLGVRPYCWDCHVAPEEVKK